MKQSYLIMTDSGGIEEEAPLLGKPLVILCDMTERTKIVSLSLGDIQKIVDCVKTLLNDAKKYKEMIKNISPYGEGTSAEKITKIILSHQNLLDN